MKVAIIALAFNMIVPFLIGLTFGYLTFSKNLITTGEGLVFTILFCTLSWAVFRILINVKQ